MGSFANFNDCALLERCAQHAAQHPRPKRKYELDQATVDGVIVGYYWVSVPTSYNESVYPGWWYIVEQNHEQGHLLEEHIELIKQAA